MGVPSLNLTPGRSLIVTVFPPSVTAGMSAANWGKIFRFSSISYSFSHIWAKMMRPT